MVRRLTYQRICIQSARGHTMTSSSTVQWDPYNADLVHNPYPTYKRLREEAPLYYNEEFDFYALSRYADVEHGLRDKENMSSHYGDILEFIKAKSRMPDAVFIHQDPPVHTESGRATGRERVGQAVWIWWWRVTVQKNKTI